VLPAACMDAFPVSATNEHDSPTARRNSDRMLLKFATHFAWRARTQRLKDELDWQLRDALDPEEWFIERNFTISGVSIPFILFGPTGVFTLWATRRYWTDQHVFHLRHTADKLQAAFEDYPDQVHPAIVLLDDDSKPTQEFAGEPGAPWVGPCWVLGDRWLIAWLESHEDDLGCSKADVALLRNESDPERVVELARNFVPPGTGQIGERPDDVYFPN
jgi:hypothetical protein